MGNLNKKNLSGKLAIIFAFALLAAFAVFLVIKNRTPALTGPAKSPAAQNEPDAPDQNPNSAGQPPPAPVPEDWDTYTNQQLGFEFGRPKTWVLNDFTTNPKPTGVFDLGFDYIPADQSSERAITYCEAYSGTDSNRCEIVGAFTADWQLNTAMAFNQYGGAVGLSLTNSNPQRKEIFKKILSTFQFTQE